MNQLNPLYSLTHSTVQLLKEEKGFAFVHVISHQIFQYELLTDVSGQLVGMFKNPYAIIEATRQVSPSSLHHEARFFVLSNGKAEEIFSTCYEDSSKLDKIFPRAKDYKNLKYRPLHSTWTTGYKISVDDIKPNEIEIWIFKHGTGNHLHTSVHKF